LLRTLRDPQQPTAERIRAGFALGRQGDPRFPVRLDEWREELKHAQQRQSDGYFCYVPAGDYIIGSGNSDPDARDNEKPAHYITLERGFWIARYPITNAQWQEWVRASGTPSRYADNEEYNHPNQPVVGVSWEDCRAFCRWLLSGSIAPIHLPTEAEWEAAARGIGFRGWRYTWGDEWHNDRAASAEDRETRGTQATVPVGCYPLGAAPCGALDMLGNVWEWTGSSVDYRISLYTVKGGSFRTRRSMIRCAARAPASRDARDPDLGFRVVVWPKKVVSPVSSQSYSKER
jgi:formylglycine-generating enzyme required for sulfatase activity